MGLWATGMKRVETGDIRDEDMCPVNLFAGGRIYELKFCLHQPTTVLTLEFRYKEDLHKLLSSNGELFTGYLAYKDGTIFKEFRGLYHVLDVNSGYSIFRFSKCIFHN